jgi:hypothetical protein
MLNGIILVLQYIVLKFLSNMSLQDTFYLVALTGIIFIAIDIETIKNNTRKVN